MRTGTVSQNEMLCGLFVPNALVYLFFMHGLTILKNGIDRTFLENIREMNRCLLPWGVRIVPLKTWGKVCWFICTALTGCGRIWVTARRGRFWRSGGKVYRDMEGVRKRGNRTTQVCTVQKMYTPVLGGIPETPFVLNGLLRAVPKGIINIRMTCETWHA